MYFYATFYSLHSGDFGKKYLRARNVRIELPTVWDSDKMNIPIRK